MNAACTTLDLPTDPEHYALGGRRPRPRARGVRRPRVRRHHPPAICRRALLGESADEDAAEEAAQAAEVPRHRGTPPLVQQLLERAPTCSALEAVEDVRGGALIGLATPGSRRRRSAGAAGFRRPPRRWPPPSRTPPRSGSPMPRRSAHGSEMNGYRLGERTRDLSLESFVLRPDARSYAAEALATELGGASFEPKPRKPAESTLKKETQRGAGRARRLRRGPPGRHGRGPRRGGGAHRPHRPGAVGAQHPRRARTAPADGARDDARARHRDRPGGAGDLAGRVRRLRRPRPSANPGRSSGRRSTSPPPSSSRWCSSRRLGLPTTRKISSGYSHRRRIAHGPARKTPRSRLRRAPLPLRAAALP